MSFGGEDDILLKAFMSDKKSAEFKSRGQEIL